MAGATLQANDIALQVVGQNIANANTPGYTREVVNFTAGPSQTTGSLVLGTGVQILSITQQVNNFLEGQLRTANSNQASADTLKGTYTQLENILGALNSGSNLSSAMNQFFNSISDVLNQPGDESVYQSAVLQGQSLAQTINSMANQTVQLRSSIDAQISGMAPEINSLTSQIAKLNLQIAQVTGGGQAPSDANGLSDQRNQALSNLSQLIGIQVNIQSDGSVSVYNGGNYLVQEGSSQPVDVAHSGDRGITISTLQIEGSNDPLQATSGQLQGLVNSRDDVLGGFQDQLNSFTSTLTNEFNKIYSGGQGTTGYTQTTSLNAVSDPNAPLNQASLGLPLTPINGALQIIVTNKQTGASTTTNIPVPLLGPGHDTTLNSLATAINGVSGLTATVSNGLLTISAGPNTQFAFGTDTSGTLAALGINTFFTGSQAGDIGVNNTVLQDPTKFAASTQGVGTDTTNAQTLAGFLTLPLASQNGTTIQTLYNNITTGVTASSAAATATANAADTLQTQLSSQETDDSGVSIDNEVVNMMNYQEAYQASAKYISTLNDLLTALVQL
ncbi:MAG: flagellar hook-associated protein FlgK [Thermoguttaceae bacterium]